MSEWFKEPVLKTGESETAQGFKSLSLRHILGSSQEAKATDFDSVISWVRPPPAQPKELFLSAPSPISRL